MSELGELRRQVNEKFGRADIPSDKKDDARELLNDGVNLGMFDGEKPARRFLVTYLQNQRRAFVDDDGDRETPLCSCPRPTCDVKKANIPGATSIALQSGESLSDALFEFRKDHTGDAVALAEAREAWDEKRRQAKDELRQALTILSEPQTEGGDVEKLR